LVFGTRRFWFDQPFAGIPPGIDLAFEVSVDGIAWSPPTAWAYVGPNSVTFQYPAPFWGSLFWRVITTPAVFSWAPAIFTPPQTGGIPFP
jgi:hypothetical protein